MLLADYVVDRLAAAGVRHLFGVPGDYNLVFLDHVLESAGMEWIGNTNELNAAYAADGYARQAGIGALAVTHGVGELSAANGVAGAYAEHVPVVVLGSLPPTPVLAAHKPVHHSFFDGDHDRFVRVYAEFTCYQAVLTADNAAIEWERALRALRRHQRPVYVGIPADLAEVNIGVPDLGPAPAGTDSAVALFVAAAGPRLAAAKHPVLVVGHEAGRFRWRAEVEALAASGIPVAITVAAKGVLDESAPAVIGVYQGAASEDDVRAIVEGSDCVLFVGTPMTDTETAAFRAHLPAGAVIEVRAGTSTVASRRYEPVDGAAALRGLRNAAVGLRWELPDVAPVPMPVGADADAREAGTERLGAAASRGEVVQDELWPSVAAALRADDIVVVDQGTATWGMLDQPIPAGTGYIAASLWGSIGYALPAAFGAALASPGRRVVLLIGDGSLALTVQELATIARYDAEVTVLVVTNAGYTIERAINGPKAAYNDIADWDQLEVATALSRGRITTIRANSTGEVGAALRSASGPTVIEVATAPLDLPRRLRRFTDLLHDNG